MMTLVELAQELDRLDPSADWERRIEIAETMKPLLGERLGEFEQKYEQLLSTAEKTPATKVVRGMEADRPLDEEDPQQDPLDPIVYRICLARRAAAEAANEIVRKVVIGQLELALQKIAELRTRAQLVSPLGLAERATKILREESPDSEEPLRAGVPPQGKAAPEPPPLAEEERLVQAAAAFRSWRNLALQPQVAADDLARASAAWTTARDMFPVGTLGAVKLQAATDKIDAEIAEARQRPTLYPNQLPGAIRVP